VNVSDTTDLGKIRHWTAGHAHDDERLSDRVVTLHRVGQIVGTIACADDELSWTAYRLCAGMRFKRENAAAWAASELAALDEPLALAA
jgi:hypothetical protein